MTKGHLHPAIAVDELRIAGEVVTAHDASWEEARRAWNLAVDQRPALIAYPESAEDVAEIVRYAAANGLRVAAQGPGHGAVSLGSLEHAILVKTSRMRRVSVDAETRTARVEAGAEWHDVVPLAAELGLAALHGSSPGVGVVGYTLGGGMGWLARKHGLAANSVVAFEVVTPDGALRRVDADNDPDLFWALRGGGGSFGVVTAMEFTLYPYTEAYAGWLWFPAVRAGEVLQAWRRWTAGGLPDEITSVARIMQFPPIPEMPEPVRGKSFVVVEAAYLGTDDAGRELLRPLRALEPVMDDFAVVPIAALAHLHKDPTRPVAGAGDGMLLRELTPEAVDALVAVAGPDARSPLMSVELRHLGGELRRARAHHGALATIDAEYALSAVGSAATPEDKLRVEMHVDRVQETLARWSAETAFMNFTGRVSDVEALFPRHTVQRLRRVKTQYDPANVLQAKHEVASA